MGTQMRRGRFVKESKGDLSGVLQRRGGVIGGPVGLEEAKVYQQIIKSQKALKAPRHSKAPSDNGSLSKERASQQQ